MRDRHLFFSLVVTIFCLVLLLIPYVATSSDAIYCRRTLFFWNLNDCWKFAVHGRSAELVLVGDSSLIFGIRPDALKQKLGLSAINLGLPAGGVIFYPELMLDDYLAHNRRPRLIVLYVSPWTFVKQQKDLPLLLNDTIQVTLRHGSLNQIAQILSAYPSWLIRFPVIFLQRQTWRHILFLPQTKQRVLSDLRKEEGWMDYRGMAESTSREPLLAPNCHLPAKQIGVLDLGKINRFRSKYENGGTRVMIYIAPVPDCDMTHGRIVAAYRGVSDNQPATLPSQYFIDDNWRVHLVREGADRSTSQMINFLSPFIPGLHG